MSKVVTFPLSANLIDKASEYILDKFFDSSRDLSRVACVFGGRRPHLFLRKALAEKIKKPYFPPHAFSIDEFIEYVLAGESVLKKISHLDACYSVFTLAKKYAPALLGLRVDFGDFLGWGSEIVSFIEQLDLEDIPNDSLLAIQRSAAIGYDVPGAINDVLKSIVAIRKNFHKALKSKGMFSRGLMYKSASERIKKVAFPEFDAIIFCNFFYLHKTEIAIAKEIFAKDKGIFLFQGDQSKWRVLEENALALGAAIVPQKIEQHSPRITVYEGFDIHSQVACVRTILAQCPATERTVVVLPRPEVVVPLLSEVSSVLGDVNVSLGYPLKKSPLYALFSLVIKAQMSKKGTSFWTKDYLRCISHPFVKNLAFSDDAALTRVLVHKIEEVLTGKYESELGGAIFVSLSDLEGLSEIVTLTRDTLRTMGKRVTTDTLCGILKKIHQLVFRSFDAVSDFCDFVGCFETILNVLVEKSVATSFTINAKVLERLLVIKDELSSVTFLHEKFSLAQMCSIFLQRIEKEVIAFSGSPLKGVQILGLFETRSLQFDNVIIMDLNEGTFPRLQFFEPLIPREVMLHLGLNRLEKEEEIQRYQFMRLVHGAKNVFLVCEASEAREKSRFIEELTWQHQKKTNTLSRLPTKRAAFNFHIMERSNAVAKTKIMVEALKQSTYSASRLNTYLNCPLQFYYQYVLGLKERDDLLDEPQAPHIGTFIHELLEETFSRFIGTKPVIDREFHNTFFSAFKRRFSETIAKRMKSDSFLLEGVIVNRLERFLSDQSQSDVEKILCLEETFYDSMRHNDQDINFVYTVDRIDQYKDQKLIIIDYKTGSLFGSPRKLSALSTMEMNRESIKSTLMSFQLPLYYYFVSRRFPDCNVNAQLFSIRNLEKVSFISEAEYIYKDHISLLCMDALHYILDEIFDISIGFIPSFDERRCRLCAFSPACK